MPSLILVTAADDAFFDLLRGLLASIETQRAGREVVIAVFDLGLTREQRTWLEERVDAVVEPGWDLDLPESLRAEKPHLRGLTVRPFLPRHFPGYDIYLWVDADVWLQDWRGLSLYAQGAARGCLVAAAHTDRAYPVRADVLSFRREELRRGYGKELADRLFLQHHLNAGVFAAPADTVLWDDWTAAFQEGIDASEGEMINDQAALNVACYRRRPPMQLLPATFNWQCHLALPMWDPRVEKFCEPMLPHQPISVMHLTDKTKDDLFDIRGLDGRQRRLSLRAPDDRATDDWATDDRATDDRAPAGPG